jgi:signal transduction histidine kinase
LLSLINDILNFSPIEAGRLECDDAPFSLRGCVHAAVTSLDSLAQPKGLKIFVEIGEAVPEWVQSDATRIRQILLNLIANAVKFTNKGSITVRVPCARATTQ